MITQVKPYSEITKKNIYDYSHTGGSKTTRAREFIELEISNKRPVIVVMQDYSTLETTYQNRFSPTVLSKSLVVKGKTQPGMCTHYERYSQLHAFVQPPNECPSCPKRNSCKYQSQKTEFNALISSSEGFVILTTPRMLDTILKRCESLQPSIIIDDVPISQVITKEISDTDENLNKLITECDSIFCEKLSALAKMLLEKKSPNEILEYTRENGESIKGELNKIQTKITATFTGSEKFAKYDSLFGLLHAVSCDTLVDIYYDDHGIFGMLKIFSTKKDLQQHRIFYLNASRNYIDEYYLDQLKDLEPVCIESGDNPQFTVYQLIDAKYSRSSIQDSNVVVGKVTETCNLFNQLILDLEVKIPFFTHDRSYENKFKPDINFQKINHSFVKFYGSKTKGTNEFINIPLSVIVGTPFLPTSYFMHPAFKEKYKTKSQIAKEVITRNKKMSAGQYAPPVYPVCNAITEHCAVEQLIQVIGRTLRVNLNNPDQEKFVILFSKLDDQDAFEKECKNQNGAIVIPFYYDKASGKTFFFKALRKSISTVFRPVIVTWIFKKIDEELAHAPYVKFSEFSKKMADDLHGFISHKTIERDIQDTYETGFKPLGERGRDILVILKKKMSA